MLTYWGRNTIADEIFHIHFHELKLVYFDLKFTEICLQGYS